MKRNKAEPVGDLVRALLRQEGLETPLNEYRLIKAWPGVVGQTIAHYSEALYIRNQVLYVHFTSAVLRQEVSLNRTVLVQQLNRSVGASVITDIVFR